MILDARRGHWKAVRSHVKEVCSTLTHEELAQLAVIRPDAFWDKQRVETCTSNQTEEKVSSAVFHSVTGAPNHTEMIPI